MARTRTRTALSAACKCVTRADQLLLCGVSQSRPRVPSQVPAGPSPFFHPHCSTGKVRSVCERVHAEGGLRPEHGPGKHGRVLRGPDGLGSRSDPPHARHTYKLIYRHMHAPALMCTRVHLGTIRRQAGGKGSRLREDEYGQQGWCVCARARARVGVREFSHPVIPTLTPTAANYLVYGVGIWNHVVAPVGCFGPNTSENGDG